MAVEPEFRLSDKFQALSDLITAQIVRGPVTFHTESFPFALNFLLLASTAFTFSSPCFTRPFLNTKPSIFDLELTVPQIPNEHCGTVPQIVDRTFVDTWVSRLHVSTDSEPTLWHRSTKCHSCVDICRKLLICTVSVEK